MAKAYGMWAGEEPYNCTKRGTVIVGKDGKIAKWEEVPMREPRKVSDLAAAVASAKATNAVGRKRPMGQRVSRRVHSGNRSFTGIDQPGTAGSASATPPRR